MRISPRRSCTPSSSGSGSASGSRLPTQRTDREHASIHNMSAPPRTEVRAEKRGIADRIVVFSLIYALTVRGFLEKHERPEKLPNGRDFEEIPWNYSSDERSTIRVRWPSPGDLFARIGEPKHLPITADFLIGWRVGILTDGSYLCPDPQIVAGVQARCSGNLYLSRRDPDLSWERLLSAPIAFDEPAISALFP